MPSTLYAKILLVGSVSLCQAAYAENVEYQNTTAWDAADASLKASLAKDPAAAAAATPAAKKTVIFSNFSSDPLRLYNAYVGWSITGPNSQVGVTLAEAMPFTPAVTTKVKKINIALGLVAGNGEVLASLNADDNGLPGAVIKSFRPSGLPYFNTCCEIETLKFKDDVTVIAGTQYWVVVKTPKNGDSWIGWNQNVQDQTARSHAFYYNDVWQLESGPLGAFEVLGK